MRVYLDNCGYNRPFDDQSQGDTFDYTEWRNLNLFQGETVDSLCDQIEQFQKQHADSDHATAMA